MILGLLQFDLLIHDAQSLKDKRRVVSSVKDRLHREHQASVAEVGLQDTPHVARMALALAGSDARYVGQTLDRITSFLRALHDAELGDTSRRVIRHEDDLQGVPVDSKVESSDKEIDAEMLRRAGEGSAQ